MITVTMNEAQARFAELVDAVQKPDEWVMICRDGKPVAHLVRGQPVVDRLPPDPSLHVTLRYDPTEPLAEDEVPKDYR